MTELTKHKLAHINLPKQLMCILTSMRLSHQTHETLIKRKVKADKDHVNLLLVRLLKRCFAKIISKVHVLNLHLTYSIIIV